MKFTNERVEELEKENKEIKMLTDRDSILMKLLQMTDLIYFFKDRKKN
ncbi:hypothetical protein V7187_03260 [Gottfriedia acidiceleris]